MVSVFWGAACRLLKTNSGLSIWEMWFRKSARQGAAWEGAEWEVLAIVREVWVWMVRERCARRRLGAMVVVAGDLERSFVGTLLLSV